MLQQTKDARLRFKLAKCSFGNAEVEFLGHKVKFGEVRPNDKHRECLQHFSGPTKATELLRFLGLLQFFSTHIDHLPDLSALLYELLKGTPWNQRKKKREIIRVADWEVRWCHEQTVAFRKLRSVLADPLSLILARRGTKKRLCTDAIKYGLGAALLQWEMKRKVGCRLDSHRGSSKDQIPAARGFADPTLLESIVDAAADLSRICREAFQLQKTQEIRRSFSMGRGFRRQVPARSVCRRSFYRGRLFCQFVIVTCCWLC
jgi:hypothetical protein